MRLVSYADVYTSDHSLYNAYQNGRERTSGHLLADVLEETGGKYEVILDLPQKFLRQVSENAAATDDSELAAAAEATEFRVSLEHLRGHDPSTTRIVYGYILERDASDPPLAK